jgi:spore germination cell wall hydrolase CwlJ-like protein
MTSAALPFARLWQTHRREAVGLATLGGVALAVLAGTASSSLGAPGAEPLPPPVAAPATALRPIAADEAMRINATLPLDADGGPAARPFVLPAAAAVARANATECLTSAIYYEAGQESDAGQRAVAQVILNRVRHPAFPASVCGVVYEGSTRITGCQFTFTCDGSLGRGPAAASWARARRVAEAALAGQVYAPVGNATHYHANYVLPYWASSLARVHKEGAHIFYRWNGGWGRPAAFVQGYAAREANPAVLRSAALSVERATAAAPTSIAAMPITKVEGVTVRSSGDGGRRVRVLFTPEARKAADEAASRKVAYVERVAASDNLRYALGDGTASEAPLGRPAPAPPAGEATVKAN